MVTSDAPSPACSRATRVTYASLCQSLSYTATYSDTYLSTRDFLHSGQTQEEYIDDVPKSGHFCRSIL